MFTRPGPFCCIVVVAGLISKDSTWSPIAFLPNFKTQFCSSFSSYLVHHNLEISQSYSIPSPAPATTGFHLEELKIKHPKSSPRCCRSIFAFEKSGKSSVRYFKSSFIDLAPHSYSSFLPSSVKFFHVDVDGSGLISPLTNIRLNQC